jgi:PAS domain S-box-containing protein
LSALPRAPWKREAWSGLGIRARLFLLVTLVLGGVAIAISLYLPAQARQWSLAALDRETTTVGRLAAHSVTPALLFGDRTDAELVLEGVRATAGIAYLEVIGPDNKRFASAGEVDEPGSVSGDPTREPGDPLIRRSSTPIVHSGNRIGTVHLGASLAGLERDVKRVRNIIWALSALLFLFATAITVAIGAPVIRPLAGMVLTAQRISEGRHSERVAVTSRDEAGKLARAMNLMLDNLQQARGDLEKLNRDLEDRVEDRTRELEREIDERKRGQEALQRANERFELAASAVEGAIYDWNAATNVVFWSDGLSRVFGHRASEAFNTFGWWASQIHPEDQQRVRAQFESDLAAGRDFLCEYRFRGSDNRYLNVLDRGRLLRDASGAALRMVGVMENITALRQLEEQFLHSQRMEAVGRLAGGVAHDFNNLLTTILGYSEILAASLDASDPQAESVAEIRKAGERASGLTQQLLAFSRKQPVSPRVLDVRAVLTEMENMLRRLIGEDVLLGTSFPSERLYVRADRSQLDQLVINVAVNARDAMPKGGSFSISASAVDLDDSFVRAHLGAQAGAHVLIEFRDTGTGMSADTLGRIFEPFYTTKEVGKGTGLGMSIVYGIVSQNGGYVAVESAPGAGTCVRVYLPVSPEAPEAVHPPAAAPVSRGAERIMVVEDEAALRGLLRRHLKNNGYEVIEARDGAQALQVARAVAGKIDLVLTDVVMPVMSGREMAERLRKERADVNVLYMSGYPEDRTTDHADLAGNLNYISKPFALQDLLLKIRETLDSAV